VPVTILTVAILALAILAFALLALAILTLAIVAGDIVIAALRVITIATRRSQGRRRCNGPRAAYGVTESRAGVR
jgi:hypothetical protein